MDIRFDFVVYGVDDGDHADRITWAIEHALEDAGFDISVVPEVL